MLKYLMLLAIISNAEQLTVVQQFQQLTRQLPFLGSSVALGVADAMARTGLPYTISFVIRRSGVVLDGTPLGQAIEWMMQKQSVRRSASQSIASIRGS